jgi:hypothetical protein
VGVSMGWDRFSILKLKQSSYEKEEDYRRADESL